MQFQEKLLLFINSVEAKVKMSFLKFCEKVEHPQDSLDVEAFSNFRFVLPTL